MRRKNTAGVLPFVLIASAAAAFADDPPDSEWNPVTGYTESVDIASASGNRVRHTEDRGHDGRIVTLVSSSAGANPRLAIKASGNSWVTWWADASTDAVHCIVRNVADGTWSADTVVSDAGESSRNPEIAHSGTATWIAYEIASASSTSVAVQGITDDVDPLGRTVVGTTTYGGDVDVLMHAESGHVWVTWVDSASNVGWSEYDHTSGTWDSSQFESYVGIGVNAARTLIRATVLGL